MPPPPATAFLGQPLSMPPTAHANRSPTAHKDRHPIAAADVAAASTGRPDEDGDAEAKYARRGGFTKRTLAGVFPSLFYGAGSSSSAAQGLPLTSRDAATPGREASFDGGGGLRPVRRRPRRRGGCLSMRSLLISLAVLGGMGTMVFMFMRLHLGPELHL